MALLRIYLCLVVLAVLELYVDSAWWPALATLGFMWFYWTLLKVYPIGGRTLFAFALGKLQILLSLIFIACNFYVKELGYTANGPVYSAYFALLAALFLHVAAWTCTQAMRRFHPQIITPAAEYQSLMSSAVLAIVGVTILALLYTGRTLGFALLTGTDRFEFAMSGGGLFVAIIAYKPIFAALLGTIRFRLHVSHAKRLACDGLMALFVILVMLFGEKFNSVIVMVGYYALPNLVMRANRKILSVPLLLGGLGLMALTLSASWYVYSDYGKQTSAATADRLFGRATGTGQLWYAAVNDRTRLVGLDMHEIGKNVDIATHRGDSNATAFDNNVGVFYMIRRYASVEAYASIRARNGSTQFTGATEAYLLLILGHVPLIGFMIVFGVVVGLLAYYFVYSLACGSLIGVFIATYLLIAAGVSSAQASLWTLFGIRTIAYFGVLMVVELFGRRLMAARHPAGGVATTRWAAR